MLFRSAGIVLESRVLPPNSAPTSTPFPLFSLFPFFLFSFSLSFLYFLLRVFLPFLFPVRLHGFSARLPSLSLSRLAAWLTSVYSHDAHSYPSPHRAALHPRVAPGLVIHRVHLLRLHFQRYAALGFSRDTASVKSFGQLRLRLAKSLRLS